MRHIFLLAYWLCSTLLTSAQNAQNCKLVLSGHIEDADTKEKLAGASISIQELNVQFITDENGDFRYQNICPGAYTVQVSHAGCETILKKITLIKNRHLDILMPHMRHNLEEVIVEGRKPLIDNGFHRQVETKDLDFSKGSSIAEALAKLNGITLLQTGSTISKPIIHGLHSNRILTINNGVKQEGQQWGNEHAPEIDTYIADRLSVIKGVEALKYGSDAIGGVVLIEPRPVRNTPGYSGEFNTGYYTNNRQYVLSGIFENQLKKLSAFNYRLQGTFKKGGNVKTPGYRLNNTGVQERNFSVTANWKKDHYQVQAYYSQFGSQIGIFPGSHIGNLTDLLNIIPLNKPDEIFLDEKTYGIRRPRQEVLHRLFRTKSTINLNHHTLHFTFAGQYNHRKEYDIVRNPDNTRPQVSLAIITLTEEVAYEHPSFHDITGTMGISLMQQDNSYSGRYLIPNYLSSNYGAYWIEKWKRNKWNIEAGIRFDDKSINTRRLKFNGTRIDHDFNFTTLGSSLNSGYRISNNFRITLNGSFTSRAPHVNELLIDGIHEGAGTYEQGDIHLKTEKSFNLSSELSYKKKNFSVEMYLYHQLIDDFIYQQPKPDEPVLTIVGAFPMIRYQQTDALLKGMDFSVNYTFLFPLQLSSRLSVLRSMNRKTDDWMILMPGDRWRNGLTYNFKEGKAFTSSYVSAEVVSTFEPRVPSDNSGKQDYKAPPGAYTLVNLNAYATVHVWSAPFTIGIGVNNLFNKAYRDYLNSFRYYTDEMGRNIQVFFKFPFEKIVK